MAGGVFAALLGAFLSDSTGEPGEGGYTTLWLAASGAAVVALAATAFSRRREG
ncbi:hypothetical protein [Streptomyces sp. NPDC048438]|uniref:hypothetical protein n=1 Tax=Streptomyces sp. NPDC048438 TaxID=3365551 RepID=UPI00371049E2